MIILFELQELRAFVAVLESGGFQKASKGLRVSQPAVSQALANLERKLGEKVLVRTSPVQATPLGRELLKSARVILEQEREFLHDLKRVRHGYLQKLSLAVDYLVNESHCHLYMTAMLKQLPEVKFRIRRLPAREMIAAVMNGEFEVGFGAFQKNMPKLNRHKMFEETTYLVTAKKNPSFKIYDDDPFAFLDSCVLLSSYLDDPEDRPSKKKIRHYFKDVWEVSNISLQIKLLAQGVGATFIPETILRNDPVARRFVVLDKLPFSTISKPYGIYYKRNAELSDAAEAFVAVARERSQQVGA